MGRRLSAVRRDRRRAPISRTSTATTTSTSASAIPARWPVTPPPRPWPPSSGSSARHHAHAADRGRDRLGRGAAPAVRAPLLAVHDHGDRREPVRAPAGPPHLGPIQGGRPRPQLPRLGRRDVRLARCPGCGGAEQGQHRSGGRPGPDHPGRAVQRHRRARAGAGRPGRGRGPRRAGPHERRHRPARTRLPRCAASTDPRDGHDPDHRRDPHDLRRAGRSDPGLGARPGHARDRQDDRWRHPGRHVRVHRGDRRPDLVARSPSRIPTWAASAGPSPAMRCR